MMKKALILFFISIIGTTIIARDLNKYLFSVKQYTLIVSTYPPDADIYIDGKYIGNTPFDDQVEYIQGTYDLKIVKECYQDYNSKIVFGTNQRVVIKPTPIKLVFICIKANIKSNPDSAQIFINGFDNGVTPKSLNLENGDWIELKKEPGYRQDTITINNIDPGQDTTILFNLQPIYGTIILNTALPGAEVYLDDNKVGITPFKNNKIITGDYLLRVKRKYMEDYVEDIQIKEEQAFTRSVPETEANFGYVEIIARNAKIHSNDAEVGNDYWSGKFEPGKYLFYATRTNHKPDSIIFTVKKGLRETITLNPKPIKGSIEIKSWRGVAEGSRIYINGNRTYKTTPFMLDTIIGDYEFLLEKEGFKGLQAKHVTLIDGLNPDLELNIEPYNNFIRTKYPKIKKSRKKFQYVTYGTAALGGFFTGLAAYHYDRYKTAKTNVKNLRIYVIWEDRLSYFFGGVALGCMLTTLILREKEKKYKRSYDLLINPSAEGISSGIRYRF